MEQAVSRRKKVKIIIVSTYDDSRAKMALWIDPQEFIEADHVTNRTVLPSLSGYYLIVFQPSCSSRQVLVPS